VKSSSLLNQLVADGGVFRLGDARFILIRPETLVGVHKALARTHGASVAESLAEGGRTGGARAVRGLRGSVEERATALAEMGSQLGWGTFTVESVTPTTFVIAVENSPFPEAHGSADAPVCHLIRGVFQALADDVFRHAVRIVESECVATGSRRCVFQAVDAPSGATRTRGEMGGMPHSPHGP
jgi:predicted hydrocarbon binding protein